MGAIHYLAPETLAWESLEVGHSAFIQWAFAERLRDIYGDLRWEGWQAEMATLGDDRCFSFYPFLLAKEGSTQTSARRPVSVEAQYGFLYFEP